MKKLILFFLCLPFVAWAADTTFTEKGGIPVREDIQWWQDVNNISYRGITVLASNYGYSSGNTAAQNDAALLAAMNAVAAKGGGTVALPCGNFNHNTVAYTYTVNLTVNLKGCGTRATTLVKTTSNASPVLDFSGPGSLEIDSEFSDFGIFGNAKSSDCFRLTTAAKWRVRNVTGRACDTGLSLVGSLIAGIYDSMFDGNNVGIKTRISGSIRANLIQIIGGRANANSSFALDIGDSSGTIIVGMDIEGNGTNGDANTGCIRLRSTNGTEFGFANISILNGWFEANLGTCIYVEAQAGLRVSVRDTLVLNQQAGRAYTANAIGQSLLENVTFPGAGDTALISATASIITGGVINTITDTSTYQQQQHVQTGGGEVFHKLVTSGITVQVDTSGNIITGVAGAILRSSVSMNNGAGGLAGTLTNSPVTGNPSKWIPFIDNGVTRYIPAW